LPFSFEDGNLYITGVIAVMPFSEARKQIAKNAQLYMLLIPSFLVVFVFAYIPIPGLIVSFMDYNVFKGFTGSKWVGFEHIRAIFELPDMLGSIWNTLLISILTLFICFPAPIILAILLNELRQEVFKRVVQTVFYLPHFLSWISVIGIAYGFYSMYGPLNDLRVFLMGHDTERIMFLSKQSLFIPNVMLLSRLEHDHLSRVDRFDRPAALRSGAHGRR
jgi:putative aldouronate transport system permease protein